MNTKRKLGTLVLVGGLAIATWAFAQTAFKADGIIESTQGGFKFPDQSVQTTAYGSSPVVYNAWDNCDIDVLTDSFNCYFDVPDGKILMIERIGGSHLGTDQPVAYMAFQGMSVNFFLPTVSQIQLDGFIFEAMNVGYAGDFNQFSDRDFVITGHKKIEAEDFTSAQCYVNGRLYDAPEA